jgi:hypothetical protein
MRALSPLSSSRGCAAVLIGLGLVACSVPAKQAGSADAGAGQGPGDSGSGGGVDAAPDRDAPDTTLDSAPAEFSNTRQATFEFSSNDPTATFQCRIDEEDQQTCTSPYVRPLPDGPHSFSVRAVDAAGNSDDSPAERLWTIDTVAPTTKLDDKPPAADNSVAAVFKFSSPEPNVTFECSLDGGAFAACASGDSFGPIGDGTHSFTVRARDRAGNVDPAPPTAAWSVDTSTPDTQILTEPDAVTAQTSASFTFVSPDAGPGSTFQCALDTATFTACSSPMNYPGLREGMHSFAVRVRDANGNVDPSPADLSWMVDLTPPTTTIGDAPSGAEPSASASVSFTSNEAGATFTCALDGGAFGACTSPALLTQLGQGAHAFQVRATDAAGHTDASPASVSWTVDTVAPDVALTSGPGANATVGPRVVVGFTASDGAVMCSLDAAAFAACASPIAVNLPAGSHQVSVRATDTAGNVTTVNRGFTVACGGPDPAVEAGVLHLDTYDQTLANAVAGGAPATLGDTADPEAGEPAALSAARFGGGLQFTSAEGDHVAWPLGLAAMNDLTVEAWAQPAAVSGVRDLLTSSDGRIALRVNAVSPTTVMFSISITEDGTGQIRTATSAAVDAGHWHYVLASLQQPALRLWVDGARTDAPTPVQLASPLALDAVRLGGSGGGAYDGALDEIGIAQTAITADEPALARYCPVR